MLRTTTVALGRASLPCAIVALALYAPRAFAAMPGFTLDSILAAPFVDNLATSVHGDGLA